LVRVLGGTYLRPGSDEYTAMYGSYGLTTLRRRHATVEGDRVLFDFRGKGGKRQHVELGDRTVAALVRELKKLPGARLFRYRDPEGRLVAVSSSELNGYIKELLGGPFTAKDFRTWAGTFVCAAELMQVASGDMPKSARERRRVLVQAIRKTAGVLQNTPTVARASYIDPRVIASFENGRAPDHPVVAEVLP
jgi:DNA topoisomerase-1